MRRRTLIAGSAIAAFSTGSIMSETTQAQGSSLDPQNTIYMDIKYGRVVIETFPDSAPKSVERIKTLCREHFYDNTPFHRVIEGFMAQGGDPTGTGTGGSSLPDLPAEFTTRRHFVRGTCGMARTQDPNSANSQFFIMFAPAPHLDGQVHDLGPGGSGHGFCRSNQARQRRIRHRQRPRPDHYDAGCRGCEVVRSVRVRRAISAPQSAYPIWDSANS